MLLLRNLDLLGGLANGTRGVVEGFASIEDYLQQVTQQQILQRSQLGVVDKGLQ